MEQATWYAKKRQTRREIFSMASLAKAAVHRDSGMPDSRPADLSDPGMEDLLYEAEGQEVRV